MLVSFRRLSSQDVSFLTASPTGISEMDKPQNASTINVDLVRRTMETNLIGLIQTTTAFLRLLRESPQPVILNVTSDMASNTMQAMPNSSLHFAAYNTSKAAVNSYTIALAKELEPEGIKVNAVTPGFTTSKLNGYMAGGKTLKAGAQVLVPWALLPEDGPTCEWHWHIRAHEPEIDESLTHLGLFIDESGKPMAW
mgnify:CR=1 FL=1